MSTEIISRSPALKAPSSQSGIAKAREARPDVSDTRLDERQALLVQVLSRSRRIATSRSTIVGSIVETAANIHVIARARHRRRPAEARMALSDMQYDGAGFEEREIAFLIGRDLSERVKGKMRGLLHRLERQKTNLVKLTHFLQSAQRHAQCPAPAPCRHRANVRRR